MQKVVINDCYGGFGVSVDAVKWMREQGYECGETFVLPGEEYDDGSVNDGAIKSVGNHWEVSRDAPGLVAAVEALGADANGNSANLKIVEVPDGIEWEIDDYDGVETVEEVHRSWR